MSILTENKYLDEITFSGGSQADYDCTALTDWTDSDTGTGASTQVTFDNKSCFKMDSGGAGAGNVDIRTMDVGFFATPEWISIKTYFDNIGTLANADYFSAVFNGTSYRLSIRFCSDGLYIYDGAAWNEVGADLVQLDTWQEWTFKWTVAAAGVVDVYRNGVLQASSVDCSDSTAGTNGTSTFSQFGTTLQGLTYMDFIKIGVAQRYGGETWSMQEGAELTVRTDTRWYPLAPATYTGSLGSQTVTYGKLIYDATDVRWLAIDTGSGDSPIGTSVTQGGVTGIYLGYYASLTAAPTTAIGATGFIKFREVTGGAFGAGAITFGAGTGAANALGADVTGWLEIVGDSATAITVARLGEHEIRGDWFYLDDTTGNIQTLQVPTNGGGATTQSPGVWIETAEASGVYEYWPALTGATNGWSRRHLGAALGETDARQNFVKDGGSGTMVIGEASDLAGTYVNTPAQASTYAAIAHTSTYAVVGNVCTVTYATGHLLVTGQTVGVEFTSGGAGALDANFAVTVIDAFTYSFALVTGDTSGNCTVRPGLAVSFASNTLGVGDNVYCDFTSGTGVDGDYEIYAVASTTIYYIKYPVIAAVTGGNVSVYSRYTIIYTGATVTDYMNLVAGNRVYLNFTSGSGVDGTYTIVYPTATPVAQASAYTWVANVVTVTFTAHGHKVGDVVYCDFTSGAGAPDGNYTIATADANTFTFALAGAGVAGNCTIVPASFDVVMNNNATADSGNVTISQHIGNLPAANCHTRIPNVFLREAATATRATNMVNAVIWTRPEWATTTAGAIDFENVYSTWYHNFSQAYSVKHHDTATFETYIISECATALDLDNANTSSYGGALADLPLTLTSDFAGGTIQNCKFFRGNTPDSSGHAVSVAYCKDMTLDNVQAGIVQYSRSSGFPIQISYGSDITLTNCRTINSGVAITTVNGVTVTNLDHIDRFIGYTNAIVWGAPARYAVTTTAGSSDITVDGVTFGYSGTLSNVHPNAGLVSATAGSNILIKNIGTFDNPMPCGNWRQNYYSMGFAIASGGNNNTLKTKRIYIDGNMRTYPLLTKNSDKNVSHENIYCGMYTYSLMTPYLLVDTGLNSVIKGHKTGSTSAAGQSSVYGTHFFDMFMGDTTGRYCLLCNEPTTETSAYFTMVAGTRRFNSAGGILMSNVNDQAVWEDMYYRKGHTGFLNITPVMSGGTIGNYTLEYDIDINDGNGFTGSWTALTGANLALETIDPADGFKLKIQITTTTANLTAITYLTIFTASTAVAQENNLYPLTVRDATFSFSGLDVGTEVVLLNSSDVILKREVIAGTSFSYDYEWNSNDGDTTNNYALIWKDDRQVIKYTGITFDGYDADVPISQTDDLLYDGAATDNVSIDFANSLIIMDAGATDYDVNGVYSIWKDTILLTNNAKYDLVFSIVGGDTISGAKTIPFYTFLENGWKIRPDEADHTLSVTGGIIVDATGDPFVDTLGAYTVRINYEQPVQAITVNTGTAPIDLWTYATRELTGVGTSGIAEETTLEKTLTTSKFLALK